MYAIELPPAVAQDRKFAEQNPDYRDGQPCVYVGMTGLSPEARFEQHRSKHKKAAKPCKKYGVIQLRPELYSHLNPMTYADAQAMEVKLAEYLRLQGYGVWQN